MWEMVEVEYEELEDIDNIPKQNSKIWNVVALRLIQRRVDYLIFQGSWEPQIQSKYGRLCKMNMKVMLR
jgi:hypothetical protein